MTFSIPIEVVDEIERYAVKSGAKSRSAAVTDLLARGLASPSPGKQGARAGR